MTSNNDLVKAEIRAGLQIGDIVESLENGTWYKERVKSFYVYWFWKFPNVKP